VGLCRGGSPENPRESSAWNDLILRLIVRAPWNPQLMNASRRQVPRRTAINVKPGASIINVQSREKRLQQALRFFVAVFPCSVAQPRRGRPPSTLPIWLIWQHCIVEAWRGAMEW